MTILLNKPVAPDLKKLTRFLEKINECGWYTNFGPLHQQLTERLEEYLGVKNLLLVSNGTFALQVAYKVLNTQSALTTPFSFVATASSLIWQGIETSFCDIDATNFNICPIEVKNSLNANKNIDTVVATHVYGNPCDLNAFDKLSKKHNVKLIYDAAHAFGVKVAGNSVLNYGDASTLSFHATKVFHTIEGGAIVFKNKSDFERAKRLINFGIDEKGNITEAGINGKLNEYQCAVGLVLLDEINEVLSHRAELFKAYRDGLQGIVKTPKWHVNTNFNGAYMPIKLNSIKERILVEKSLMENNIQCRQYFSPSLDAVFGTDTVFTNLNSKEFTQTTLCLPLHYYMTLEDVNCVLKVVKKAMI